MPTRSRYNLLHEKSFSPSGRASPAWLAIHPSRSVLVQWYAVLNSHLSAVFIPICHAFSSTFNSFSWVVTLLMSSLCIPLLWRAVWGLGYLGVFLETSRPFKDLGLIQICKNLDFIAPGRARRISQHISCFALIKRESKKQKNFSIFYKITFIFNLAWKSFQHKGGSLNILFILHKQRCGRISQFLQDHLYVRLQIFLWDSSYVLK